MGWRAKLVFVLVAYFAGFATAVYCLAPAPEQESGTNLQVARIRAAFTSEEFARSVNSGMHKCIAFGREAAWQTAAFIREKMNQPRTDSDPAVKRPAAGR